MIQLIARKPLVYAGKRYLAGGEFSASDRDAVVLQAVKLAALAAAPPPPVVKRKRGRPRKEAASQSLKTPHPEKNKPGFPDKDDEAPPSEDDSPPTADTPEQEDGASPKGRKSGTLHAKKRGSYKRRDMRAER